MNEQVNNVESKKQDEVTNNNVNVLENEKTTGGDVTKDTNLKEDSKKKKNGVGRMILLIVGILCLAGLIFLLLKRLTKVKAVDYQELPSVNVTHLRKGTIIKEISVTGSILPNDTYYIAAKVAGDIEEIYVENGDTVKRGDPICKINADKEIEAAFIQYDAARKSYERMEKLYNNGDISLQSFETVKAQYDAAKLAYDTKMEYSVPVAVADGVIENTDMILNTSIKVEKVLCYITSTEGKEINFGVTERVLDGIKLNDKVTIEKNGKTYDGYISNKANLINSSTGLFNVKATIVTPNNFASGIMAKVTFAYLKKENIDILPNEYIYYENSKPYIFTIDADGKVKKIYITVGIEDKASSEILSGIDKNTKIISTWNKDLAEGAIVKVANEEKIEDIVKSETHKKEETEAILPTESDIKMSDTISPLEKAIKDMESEKTEKIEIEETVEKATEETVYISDIVVESTENVEIPEIVSTNDIVANSMGTKEEINKFANSLRFKEGETLPPDTKITRVEGN